MKHLILGALFILLAFSCNKDETSSIITTEDLIGCWKHDTENQTTDGSTTYLMTKCDARDFPASWFRYSLIFEENNMGSEFLLAENDAHSYHDMSWDLLRQNLTINGLFQEEEYAVEIVNEESILLIKK